MKTRHMSHPVLCLLSCLLGLWACSPSPAAAPNAGHPPTQTTQPPPLPASALPAAPTGGTQSPSPLQPSPLASPSASASLPAGLAGLRLETGERFLEGRGARTQFKAVLLDSSDQVLQATVPLHWQSSRPQDFSVDAQGQLQALVDNGYSDIQVSIPGTPFTATAVINVTQFGGGTGSGLRPPSLTGLSGTALSERKYILIRDQIITLSGSGFLPGLNEVLFGALPGTVVSSSDREVTVRVPLGLHQAGDVTIRVVSRNLSSNTLTGTVLAENLVVNNGGFF